MSPKGPVARLQWKAGERRRKSMCKRPASQTVDVRAQGQRTISPLDRCYSEGWETRSLSCGYVGPSKVVQKRRKSHRVQKRPKNLGFTPGVLVQVVIEHLRSEVPQPKAALEKTARASREDKANLFRLDSMIRNIGSGPSH